jgi:hypothetical protein
MSPVDAWLARWGYLLPPEAANELRAELATNDCAPPPIDPARLSSEARVQSLIRIEAAQAGVWLTRNNVGAFMDPESGRLVRYGLANESKQQNARVKSADLIGFRKRVILASDVGTVIAQFVSRECKAEGWRYTGTKREVAQAAWRDFINSNGGDAAFASGPGSFNYTR